MMIYKSIFLFVSSRCMHLNGVFKTLLLVEICLIYILYKYFRVRYSTVRGTNYLVTGVEIQVIYIGIFVTGVEMVVIYL